MVKEIFADSELNSKVSISQAAFLSSAMNQSDAKFDFEISIVSKLLSKIYNKVPKKCLRHLLSAWQWHCKCHCSADSFIYKLLENCLRYFFSCSSWILLNNLLAIVHCQDCILVLCLFHFQGSDLQYKISRSICVLSDCLYTHLPILC